MEIHSSIGFTPYSQLAQRVGVADGVRPERAAAQSEDETATATEPTDSQTSKAEAGQKVVAASGAASAEEELTEDEIAEVTALAQRDTEVRAHEQAHMAAGGQYVTGGASYEYQQGPDGKRYAIGGEVGIDTSAVSGDPAATVAKARTLMRAALAPAEPSGQDQRVAAAARAMEMSALSELAELASAEAEARVTASTASKPAKDGSGESASGSDPTAQASGAGEGESARSASTSGMGAQARLQERIAGFFAAASAGSLSQFA